MRFRGEWECVSCSAHVTWRDKTTSTESALLLYFDSSRFPAVKTVKTGQTSRSKVKLYFLDDLSNFFSTCSLCRIKINRNTGPSTKKCAVIAQRKSCFNRNLSPRIQGIQRARHHEWSYSYRSNAIFILLCLLLLPLDTGTVPIGRLPTTWPQCTRASPAHSLQSCWNYKN
jgi:hypothetical protein